LEKRIGKGYWQLKSFLQEAQWWDWERIEAWQFEKLKEIVWKIYENVLAYHEFSREAGIKLDDMATLADVRVLPFMAQELLMGNLKELTATIFFPGG
jgi:phenylacetate-CoA ligase